MAQHNDLGRWGEKIAREYLITKGYAIYREDNREGHFEIDLIAFKGSRIIFIEVKTRRDGSPDPLDAITPTKISRMCSAANRFVKSKNLIHEVQFDIISIRVHADGTYDLEHIPDAFFPPLRGAH